MSATRGHSARPARRDSGPSTSRTRSRRPSAGRLRRLEPAARPDRRGRDLRPAEGRDAGRRRRTSTSASAAWADAARGRDRSPRTRHARRRGGRRRRLRAARDPGRVRRLRPPPGRRPRDGGDRLRRPPGARPTWSSPARAGSTPRPAFGKTALGVARRAATAGVPCIAVGGGVEPDGIEALAAVGAIAVPVTERPMTVEEAMAAGVAPVERCGERLARLVSL